MLDDQRASALADSINSIRSKASREAGALYKDALADMGAEAKYKTTIDEMKWQIADMEDEHAANMADMKWQHEAAMARQEQIAQDMWDDMVSMKEKHKAELARLKAIAAFKATL
jgi:hypothetical protein